MQLTQKETNLLNELKGQEQVCAEKYRQYSQNAHDQQLKDLFNNISSVESGHCESLTSIINGTVPTVSDSGNAGATTQFNTVYQQDDLENDNAKNDKYLCSDLLATEKHASHLYDTCLFEFRDNNIRNFLNHIQKEEQGHGKMIYDYMAKNNMYQVS